MKTSRVRSVVRIMNPLIPSHGALMLFFPWDSNSPRDGELAGSPKPKKSSEVRVVMEPAIRKGILAIIIGEAFGKICLNIILQLLAPRARVDFTKSKFLMRKNSARTIPTNDIQLNISINPSNMKNPGSIIEERIINRNKTGMLDQISMNLWKIISIFPP